MKIHRLTLANFQGIQAASFTFDGYSAEIFGDNATGKTTIANAWSWLLFDRPATGEKGFSPKPRTDTGDGRHNTDTTVEAAIDTPEGFIEIRKTLSEIWTRKTGQARPSMTGHERTARITPCTVARLHPARSPAPWYCATNVFAYPASAMNRQISVKERMPAGSAAWIAVALYHERYMRSTNCITVNEPMLIIKGYATRSTSRYPPGSSDGSARGGSSHFLGSSVDIRQKIHAGKRNHKLPSVATRRRENTGR